MIDINDYLIDQAGKDWGQLLSDWIVLFPEDFTVWMVNRFGDVFAIFDDDSVHMLDVGAGTLTRMADSQDDFCQQIGMGDNANNWLMIPLVDACVAAGMRLGPDQCYSFKTPPVLGGQYDTGNSEPMDLAVHYSFLADIHRQIKDLPDGTQIKLVVTE